MEKEKKLEKNEETLGKSVMFLGVASMEVMAIGLRRVGLAGFPGLLRILEASFKASMEEGVGTNGPLTKKAAEILKEEAEKFLDGFLAHLETPEGQAMAEEFEASFIDPRAVEAAKAAGASA